MKTLLALTLVLGLSQMAIAAPKAHHPGSCPPGWEATLKRFDADHNGVVNGHDWIALSKAADTRYGELLKVIHARCPEFKDQSAIADRLNQVYAGGKQLDLPLTKALHKAAR
jgi:hypothetical protein